MELVCLEDIKLLLDHFAKNSYRAKDFDSFSEEVQRKCEEIFQKDYKYSVIRNTNGELSTSYPSRLVFLEEEIEETIRGGLGYSEKQIGESSIQARRIRDLLTTAKLARCRTRFPVPVILFDEKHICRSSTLSGGPEIYGRMSMDYLFPGGQKTNFSGGSTENFCDDYASTDSNSSHTPSAGQNSKQWQMFDQVRSQDIRLLKTLSVSYICDLMVENKKVKYGVNITSSEKIDKEKRYTDFTILSLPYPGCEFFRSYSNNSYNAEGLVFDWAQSFVNAELDLPCDAIVSGMDVDWSKYKEWDLVTLTQNYMKLLLTYIIEGTSGLLIHCISGWDRTPLFISLLRMSLWADGKAHKSLSPLEIIYLTVAYDWYLFGHNLSDRLNKGEEILFFCFYFLKHFTSEEFSSLQRKHKRISGNSSDSQLDVLFEEENSKHSIRRSNTSLSSTCSSISNRSQENPPALFSIHPDSGEESASFYNNNISSFNCWKPGQSSDSSMLMEFPFACSHTPPTLVNGSDNQMSFNENGAVTASAMPPHSVSFLSTSPVAVPNNSRQRTESTSSVGCGSWQIITGTGSIRESESSRSSVSSPTLEFNQNSANLKLCCSQENPDVLHSSCIAQLLKMRREKLQAVRSTFYHVYLGTIGSKFRNGSESSGLSAIFDQFAEKVGIRASRTFAE